MSVRGAEGAGPAGSEAKERRASGGQRVQFEALVAVGEGAGGGFEAESVDVSPDGMRMRTAYLPAEGDKLICRFDGMGTEIVAEGEVAWRTEEAKGGEFGLRFVGLDEATAAAVRAMCMTLGEPGEEAEGPEAPAMPRGSRVRLHIEGLGSPMKARVREGGPRDLGRVQPGVPQGGAIARAGGRRGGREAGGDDRRRQGRHRPRHERAAARRDAALRQGRRREGRPGEEARAGAPERRPRHEPGRGARGRGAGGRAEARGRREASARDAEERRGRRGRGRRRPSARRPRRERGRGRWRRGSGRRWPGWEAAPEEPWGRWSLWSRSPAAPSAPRPGSRRRPAAPPRRRRGAR